MTTSMSPGSAPSMKNGPVCGFGPCATCLPFQSVPLASIVLVIDAIAGLDAQRRRMREREGVVEALRSEGVDGRRLRDAGHRGRE